MATEFQLGPQAALSKSAATVVRIC